MPYETIWEKQGVYQCFSGEFTIRDKRQAMDEVMSDQCFDTIKYWIVDSLAIEEYLLEKSDGSDVEVFDIWVERHNKNLLMAIVTTNTDHRDNVLHFMDFFDPVCNLKVGLYDDIESARHWITETLKGNP